MAGFDVLVVRNGLGLLDHQSRTRTLQSMLNGVASFMDWQWKTGFNARSAATQQRPGSSTTRQLVLHASRGSLKVRSRWTLNNGGQTAAPPHRGGCSLERRRYGKS